MIFYIIGAVAVVVVLTIALTWPRHRNEPAHTKPRERALSKQRYLEYERAQQEWGRHHGEQPVTQEFSAIAPGQNKHFIDETSEMRIIPPVPRGDA